MKLQVSNIYPRVHVKNVNLLLWHLCVNVTHDCPHALSQIHVEP